MTFYAPTIAKAHEIMAHAFQVFPLKTIKLIPFKDGYAVQVV